MIDYKKILQNGILLESSGTTGSKKKIFQSPTKLNAANQVALAVQKINSKSRIYTVCNLQHAAGLLAQTLPALTVGAHVDCVKFNAYQFVRDIKKYTHTHLTPLHAKAIMMTKNIQLDDLHGLTIACGAEPVSWDIIDFFVRRGARFIVNWGMTEVGPIAINETFTDIDQVVELQSKSPDDSWIIGSDWHCQVDIVDDELLVRGEISVSGPDWLNTGDLVQCMGKFLFFRQRKNLSTPGQLSKF